jgi:hypothetical protein
MHRSLKEYTCFGDVYEAFKDYSDLCRGPGETTGSPIEEMRSYMSRDCSEAPATTRPGGRIASRTGPRAARKTGLPS